jgi:carbon-monoxide dehydrogenase medium subunit
VGNDFQQNVQCPRRAIRERRRGRSGSRGNDLPISLLCPAARSGLRGWQESTDVGDRISMTSSPALFRPRSLPEALELLATVPEARPLSGGASLVAMMNAGLVTPAALVSLTRIAELAGIRMSPAGDIAVGAATRHSEIAGDRRLVGTASLLSHAAAQIAGTAVRNMGTIGGAIAHADPGLDFPPALVALGARIEIASNAGRRQVPAREFFVDWYTTALTSGEIVSTVHVPKPKPGVGLYLKHARVAGDFAVVSVAVSCARDGEVHVAIGGCGPAPLASAEADGILSSALSVPAALRAGEVLAALANPVDDVRASAGYRKLLIPRLLVRAVGEAMASLRNAA